MKSILAELLTKKENRSSQNAEKIALASNEAGLAWTASDEF